MAAMEWQRIRDAVRADKFETRRRGLESLQVRRGGAMRPVAGRPAAQSLSRHARPVAQAVIQRSALSRDQAGELVDMATDLLCDNNGKVGAGAPAAAGRAAE
jgi:hypothetical protein